MTATAPSLFSLARRSFWLLFGGIWLFVGVILLVFGIVFVFNEQEFSSNGVITTGIVLEKQIVAADSDSSTQYRVAYRFTTADGRTIEGSDSVDVKVWEGLVERGPIDVRYLPNRPESSRLNTGSDIFLPLVFLAFGVIFGGIGGVLVVRAMSGIRKARRLLLVGIPADATVTEIAETNVSYNRRQQFRVRYTYTDARGAAHTGESGYMDFTEASDWNPGDVARIRYDPDLPAESHWLGATEAVTGKPRIVDAPPPIDAPPADAQPPA